MSSQVRRRIVIVGIPGVGKTTVVNRIVEKLGTHQKHVKVVNYGTVMMEQASRAFSVKSRDDMRLLSVENQRKLQVYAATEISSLDDQLVIIDTHLFIATREGFWPGMPLDVLQALKPTHLVLIVASPDEILARRGRDLTRSREMASEKSIRLELEAAKSLLFSSALVTGCPGLVVFNDEAAIDAIADKIIKAVM